jgi:hypothetical protein
MNPTGVPQGERWWPVRGNKSIDRIAANRWERVGVRQTPNRRQPRCLLPESSPFNTLTSGTKEVRRWGLHHRICWKEACPPAPPLPRSLSRVPTRIASVASHREEHEEERSGDGNEGGDKVHWCFQLSLPGAGLASLRVGDPSCDVWMSCGLRSVVSHWDGI